MSEPSTTVSYAAHHQTNHAEHEPHALPLWLLIGVFLALMVLTGITVVAADDTVKRTVAAAANINEVDISRFSFIVAMLIATVKATIVALYFMHLRYDRPINALVFISSIGFLALFIVFVMVDATHYREEFMRQQIDKSEARRVQFVKEQSAQQQPAPPAD